MAKRTITCRCCGRPGPHRGHGYREACYRRWAAAGRPASGPPMPREPSECPPRPGHNAAAARQQYKELREAGQTRLEAAAQIGISFTTSWRYEAWLRDEVMSR
ncbi:hypothetical protein [Actinomadura rugatobispora]|uniref:Helix-turn-helix domain-containing protein n=1 Tax=Actinomadura rugatobispora TaxID=1994 RepID=A0ABW0ZSD9_9ACTN|nr:hypothetical protein GCM10010200_036050 [Actinomadura rugatobispora]